MDVLNLKTKTGKPFIEVPSSGAVVAWMNEHVKGMTEPEFYKWLVELMYYKSNAEQMADIHKRAMEQPLSIPPDFLFLMEITVYEMYQVLAPEIEKHIDVDAIMEAAHLKKYGK